MAASGLRSIRYALEVEGTGRVDANDLDSDVVEAMKRNIQFNGPAAEQRMRPLQGDARVIMLQSPLVSTAAQVQMALILLVPRSAKSCTCILHRCKRLCFCWTTVLKFLHLHLTYILDLYSPDATGGLHNLSCIKPSDEVTARPARLQCCCTGRLDMPSTVHSVLLCCAGDGSSTTKRWSHNTSVCCCRSMTLWIWTPMAPQPSC